MHLSRLRRVNISPKSLCGQVMAEVVWLFWTGPFVNL